LESDLETYYRLRASEYDEVYRKPERQADIALLADQLTQLVSGCRLLEVAAGTGFWTEVASRAAQSILATDIAEETLDIARRRALPPSVRLAICDAFALDEVEGTFNLGLASFWLSHLPRHRMVEFLAHLGARLEPDSLIVLADNRYVAGSNHAITRRDAAGNTYQRRVLRDGQTFEVLKNFPEPNELAGLVEEVGGLDTQVILLEYYWLLTYRTTL